MQKRVLDLDVVLAAAYQHGAARPDYDKDRKETLRIKLLSQQFLNGVSQTILTPAGYRTFNRATGHWSYLETCPPKTEASPVWEPLYTAEDLALAFRLGSAIGSTNVRQPACLRAPCP